MAEQNQAQGQESALQHSIEQSHATARRLSSSNAWFVRLSWWGSPTRDGRIGATSEDASPRAQQRP